jgi:translation initiation factor 2B subunit (eIF-2B alpha/beta/delta family)
VSQIGRGIEALKADSEAGASELAARAVDLLAHARDRGPQALVDAARAVVAAQPSMAPILNAAIAAVADIDAAGTFERFAQRLERSGAALRRVAADLLAPVPVGPLRLVTCSYSGSVRAVLAELAGRCPLTVACGEGRPRLEGRRLAAALASTQAQIEFYTDAALSLALDGAAALVLGADAVSPGWFLNKAGTASLAAASGRRGIPVFVLATRDKFLPPALFAALAIAEHDAHEVWPDAPASILVRNPYFERVPLDLVSAVVTDAGVLGTDMVTEACRAGAASARPEVLDALGLAM